MKRKQLLKERSQFHFWRQKRSTNHHHHHHQVTRLARIFMTLSHHSSLPSLPPSRSSRQHPVSIQNCCKYVLFGRLTLARPYEEVHWRKSLVSSSSLFQQCPICSVEMRMAKGAFSIRSLFGEFLLLGK